ncbi:MAG: hypothetical protein HWE10_03505 [Gammaproteobacteria bacterium]|nr:hypothetical protein [Gammaproteobacteria bacterium]
MKKVFLSLFLSFSTFAEPFIVELSTLDFKELLPISGTCQMDYETGALSPMAGSQLCIGGQTGTVAYYRLFGAKNKDYIIRVNERVPEGDSLRFEPIGKITSDAVDIDIVPGANHTVDSGASGIINIVFGGNLILSSPFAANGVYSIDMTGGITWQEVP